MDNNSLDCFDTFTARFIQSKIRKLIGRVGFRESDRDDLLQHFVLNLLERVASFDPQLGTWEAFVVVVCENCIATLLEHRRAEMRSATREVGSLNSTTTDPDGNEVEFAATVPESPTGRRTGRYPRFGEDAFDLAEDVATLLKLLPPRLQELVERLKHDSKAQAARDMGISRREVYELVERIGVRFERADMRDYLNK